MTDFSAWIGRSQQRTDRIDEARVRALNIALGEADAAIETLPPLYHWLFFWDPKPPSETGPDGHANRGGFLPPIEAPRRMWAAGKITFIAPLKIGAEIVRTSTIRTIDHKVGRTGPMTFVTVAHDIACGGAPALAEEQVIVYREAGAQAPPPPPAENARAEWTQHVDADPVMLFRYSALTMNSHRIHYDRRYTMETEGYPGLVVHGPLQATLLAGLLARGLGAPLRSFAFRGVSAAIDGPLTVSGVRAGAGGEAWIEQEGRRTMTATASV